MPTDNSQLKSTNVKTSQEKKEERIHLKIISFPTSEEKKKKDVRCHRHIYRSCDFKHLMMLLQLIITSI